MHPFFSPDGIRHPLPNLAPPHSLVHWLTWLLNGVREAPPGDVLSIGLQALLYALAVVLLARHLATAARRRRKYCQQQAELARSWAAHVRGNAPPEVGAGEWHVWPPRIPRP